MNINLPFLNTPEWQAYIQALISGDPNAATLNPFGPNFQGGGATPVPTDSYRVDGNKYTGPFANQDVTPFRTVDNGFEYGMGKNASAAQLYNHFHRKAALDKQAGNENASIADYGLTPGHRVQTIEDFLARRKPTPIDPPEDPPAPPPPPPTRPGDVPPNTPPYNPNNPNPHLARDARSMQAQAMAQFDRNNPFGQFANLASNFQPPAPPAMTNPKQPIPQPMDFDISMYNRPKPNGIY